jgi:O-antigen ligase
MQPLRIQFEPLDAPYTRFDRAIEWMLFALLAFCPIGFGAVVAWSEGVFLALASAIAITFCAKMVVRRDARCVWSWSYLPIVLFVLLVLVQLTPLPESFLGNISPNTIETRSRLLQDLPQTSAPELLTFYREATVRQLRLLLAVAAIFVVVVNVFQRIEPIRRLLIAMTFIGLAEAVLALAQDLSHSDSIYWTIRVYDGLALAGSFVNHSHFGQFMNLSIGAAIALFLLEWHEGHAQPDQHNARPFKAGEAALAIFTIVTGSVALLLSLTRGGMISMLVAAAFSFMVLRFKIRGRSQLVKTISLCAVLIALAVAWSGFDHVYHRMSSLTESRAGNWRGQMLKDVFAAWKLYPIFGTGLGTFRVVFPMFDHSQTLAVATHAENEYAQLLVETGEIGLVLIIVFLATVWRSFAQAIRGRATSATAVAIGLSFGLVAILIHSLSDFGQHIPANAAMTAVTCGLIVSAARLRVRLESGAERPQEYQAWIAGRALATAIVLIVSAIILYQSRRTYVAESQWNLARSIEDSLRKQNWQGDDNTFARLLLAAKDASDVRPGNIEYACWLNIYRWKAISRMRDEDGYLAEDQLDNARRIVDELNHVRTLCPTFGLPASIAAQIQYFVLDDADGADLIRLGAHLAPNDPTATFVAGQLAAAEQDWPRSIECMKHYIDLTSDVDDVVALYTHDFDRPDLAEQMLAYSRSYKWPSTGPGF